MNSELSIFIPTYNGKQRVERLLKSLLLQDIPTPEIHVLIDGSSDGTEQLKTKFPEVAFHNFPNGGRAAIRNKALSICTTKHLLFLDLLFPGTAFEIRRMRHQYSDLIS